VLRVSAVDIRSIQDVHSALIFHCGESERHESKTEKCDCFDRHLRPPPVSLIEPLIRLKF
jgi:hypothetical protein